MRALRVALQLLLWPPATLTAWLCAGAAVVAQWGRVSLTADILAHFAPLWLAGGAAALAVSAMFRGWRRWGMAAGALIAMASAASLIAPEFVRSTGPHAPADAPGQLKIVQFNVWHENPDPARVLAWLNAEQPDIAVIEEGPDRFRRALERQGGDWHVVCARCEVAILSRRPAVRAETARRSTSNPATPLTSAVFRDGHGEFQVVGVHNAWPIDPDQPFQERRLARFIDGLPRERLIVAGDFNSAPWSFQRRRWDRAFGLTRRERALPSWPARGHGPVGWLGVAVLPIDHVYAGPGWATVSVRRGPRLTSDHYPVIVTLAPRPAARR